jgi:hypothetical protein
MAVMETRCLVIPGLYISNTEGGSTESVATDKEGDAIVPMVKLFISDSNCT